MLCISKVIVALVVPSMYLPQCSHEMQTTYQSFQKINLLTFVMDLTPLIQKENLLFQMFCLLMAYSRIFIGYRKICARLSAEQTGQINQSKVKIVSPSFKCMSCTSTKFVIICVLISCNELVHQVTHGKHFKIARIYLKSRKMYVQHGLPILQSVGLKIKRIMLVFLIE